MQLPRTRLYKFAAIILLLRSLDFQSSLLSLGKLKASFRMLLLLRSLTVAAHELINTTCGVNELALTSVERVRAYRRWTYP